MSSPGDSERSSIPSPAVRANDRDARPLPGFSDRTLLSALAVVAVALLWSWARQSGYQIADSVEYMERAQMIARHEPLIDNHGIRAFGFSGVLLPIFLAFNWFGARDFTHAVQACQMLQIALSLALCVVAARLTARVAGRAAAIAALLIVGLNPTLLRWGVDPVSGVAAGIFVGLGLARIFDRDDARGGFGAGIFLGLGVLMAYQTISVVAPIIAFVLLRDRWKRRAHSGALLGGVLACILLQCGLDALYYDQFGISIAGYLYENFGVQIARAVYETSHLLHSRTLADLSAALYNKSVHLNDSNPAAQQEALKYQEQVKQQVEVIKQSHGMFWYFQNLSSGLPIAATVLALVGLVRVLAARQWKMLLAALVVVINVVAYGLKGSKDFRLWLPFLALIGVLGGIGWSTIAGALRDQVARGMFGAVRIAAAVALLGLACWSGVRENRATNTRHFAAFWNAIGFVSREAGAAYATKKAPAGATEVPRDRVACAYHWAVFLRAGSDVDLIKLPHHLDYWKSYTEAQRQEDLDAIASCDWFITHSPILTEFPELMTAINRDFAVRAVYYDRSTFEGLGPIFVLSKRIGGRDDRSFYDLFLNKPLSEFAKERGIDLARAVSFCRRTDEGLKTQLQLVDWKYEVLAGDGYGWITYTWCGGPLGGTDFEFVDRLTSNQPINAWQNNHSPAYGMWPTSKWGPNWILRESYLVIGEVDPYNPAGRSQFLGGEHRRGDLIPATLWMDVARFDAQTGQVVERLDPCDGDRLLRDTALFGRPPLARGDCISVDGLTRIGSFWMPVQTRARWPDDGRVVPTEQ